MQLRLYKKLGGREGEGEGEKRRNTNVKTRPQQRNRLTTDHDQRTILPSVYYYLHFLRHFFSLVCHNAPKTSTTTNNPTVIPIFAPTPSGVHCSHLWATNVTDIANSTENADITFYARIVDAGSRIWTFSKRFFGQRPIVGQKSIVRKQFIHYWLLWYFTFRLGLFWVATVCTYWTR